jgi:serine/threonine protein kinase
MMSEDFPAQLTWFRQGSLLAGYRLEAQVGTGGMAVVFRARDERLGRLVALKILAPALRADSEFRQRFIAESRAAAAAEDPNIIPIYEAGESDGVLFIAMRFVRGGDLRRVLDQEGTLSPGRAAEYISAVASALDAAHGAGLVHRDVKPANILVEARPGRPDHVYLSDFGVSKRAMSSVGLTGTGQFLGTAEYSAPEQIQGLAVDGRTDQYALACVAYQLLTGVPPFVRDQGMAVLLAHLSEPPPLLRSRLPDLPGSADQVLARGLAKVPEKRYGSCQEFADALRDALGLPLYASRGSGAAPRHPPTEIVTQPGFSDPATVGTATADGPADPPTAAIINSAPARSPDAADLRTAAAMVTSPAPVERPKVVRTFRGNGAINAVAFSPDRRFLAISADEPSVVIWDTTAPKPNLRLPVWAWAVLFSADGRWLITADRRTAQIWDTTAGKRLLSVTHQSSCDHAVALTPDSRWLATSSPDHSVRIWGTADGQALMTISVDPNPPLTIPGGVDGLAFSPDGRWLATASADTKARIFDVATGQPILKVAHGGAVSAVAFSPDGRWLATASADKTARIWDAATGQMLAQLPHDKAVRNVAFGPDGDRLATATKRSAQIWELYEGGRSTTR